MAVAAARTHNRVFEEIPVPSLTALQQAQAFIAPYLAVDWRRVGILEWAPKLTWRNAAADLVSAITVTVMLLPQALAYAVLAGLDPIYGIYSSIVPVIVYSIFTTSSQVAIGPVAPTSILLQTTMSSVTGATVRTPAFLYYNLLLALLSGCAQLLYGTLRLGVIASLLSWPVMSGFSSGAAFIIIVSQVPDLCGLTVGNSGSSFFGQAYQVLINLPTLRWQTTLLGLPMTLAVLYLKDVSWRGRKLIHKLVPLPLILMLVALLISWAANLQQYGIKLVGTVPASLPQPSMPVASWADVSLMAPSALIVGGINYVQTVSLAVLFGKKVGERVSANGEFFALGLSNVAGSFFSCYTVAGSFTRSAVQSETGARTPLTTALTGVLMAVFCVSIARAFYYLPTCVLAAIVLGATRSLISVSDVATLWRCKPSDLVQLAVSFFAVLGLGISNGLLAGVGFSLATILARSFMPRLTKLGRLPGTDVFVALDRFAECAPVPGVLVLRLDGELHFGNVARVTARLHEELEDAAKRDLSAAAAATAPGASSSAHVPGASSRIVPASLRVAAPGDSAAASGVSGSLGPAGLQLLGGGGGTGGGSPVGGSPAEDALTPVTAAVASHAHGRSRATSGGLRPLRTSAAAPPPLPHSREVYALCSFPAGEAAALERVLLLHRQGSSGSMAGGATVGAAGGSCDGGEPVPGGGPPPPPSCLAAAAPSAGAAAAASSLHLPNEASDAEAAIAASAHSASLPASASAATADPAYACVGEEAAGPGPASHPTPLEATPATRGSPAAPAPSAPAAGTRGSPRPGSSGFFPPASESTPSAGAAGVEAQTPQAPSSPSSMAGLRQRGPAPSADGSATTAAAASGVQWSARERLEQEADRLPLRAVILDGSRVVDIDATACRELQEVMEAYQRSRLSPRPLLLIAGLPGPVRDTLDAFGVQRNTDPATTRFLTATAALASLTEREREEEDWDAITHDLALMARGLASGTTDAALQLLPLAPATVQGGGPAEAQPERAAQEAEAEP